MDDRDIARFTVRLSEGPDGCWDWTGSSTKGGWGQMYCVQKDRTVKAYRWSYEYHRDDIPPGLDLDHLCRRPTCVNPWHLEPVTHAENMSRRPRQSTVQPTRT